VLRSLPAEAREGDVDDNDPPDSVLVGERGWATTPPIITSITGAHSSRFPKRDAQ